MAENGGFIPLQPQRVAFKFKELTEGSPKQ